MNESHYDKRLNIKTGQDMKKLHPITHYHPYEPTPYSALEELFRHYEVNKEDSIVDFGCGKGRLNFFIHYFYGANVTGVEMDESFYEEAMANTDRYFEKNKKKSGRIQFHCCLAEEYPISVGENRFYFFNPFSVHIFKKILHNILSSLEKHPREMEIVLYYPSEDYINFLENQTVFELKQEVILPDVYPRNPNERFLIYRYGY